MSMKHLVTALALVSFTMPALAATEWYIVKNTSTKKCEVTEKKADGKKLVAVGMNVFKTKAEAEAALKSAADCK